MDNQKYARRRDIPKPLEQQILYDSAFSCAVCSARGAHLHHIDKNNSNNTYDNLILLCSTHHDDAHTHRELSKNLTADRLKTQRDRWYTEVKSRRNAAASASGQSLNVDACLAAGTTWGYINHRRVMQIAQTISLDFSGMPQFSRLVDSNILDRSGFLLKPSQYVAANNYLHNTIYDWYDFIEGHVLHSFYCTIVDKISVLTSPIHLNETTWTKTFIKNVISNGTFIYINRAQYFKKITETQENAEIKVNTFSKGINIKYQIDTRSMFGTTSISTSFTGHRSCASLCKSSR